MQTYYGTKRIQAKPMTRLEYNAYRGWELPADENGDDAGYLVVYADSNKNTPDYDGYVSWSPKNVFDETYQPTDGMSFGHALVAAKSGHKIYRKGWDDQQMFVFDLDGKRLCIMKNNDVALWGLSQTDILADDWQIVE